MTPGMAMTRGTVRPGDLIDVYIADEPEFSGQFPVSADGKIKMPYLGVLAVGGRSTEQVAQLVADKSRKYLVDPVVVVSIVGGTSALVHIMGEVPRQGPVALDEAPNLLSLLAASGGVTPTGDLSQIVIVRGKERIRVAADAEGGADAIPANVPLSDGDMVIVPRKPEKMVFITGAVQRPGFVPIEQANTCTRAFILAGGGVSGAALSRSYVLRGPERIGVDLTRLLDGSGGAEDVALQDKDVLVVPLASSETGVGAPEVAIVAGAVLTPGAMPLAQSQSAARAVTLAGGLAPTANPSASYILRGGTRIDADLQAILRGTAEDLPLKANDILVVPSLPVDSVYVVGAVASPGPRLMTWADTLAKAITFAGGATPVADQTQCYILRGKETIPFDLGGLMRSGAEDVPLEANDLIVIPAKTPERLMQEQWERSVVVAGAVAQPTRVPLAQADSLMRVLIYAGGVTPMADLRGVQVLRGAERINLDITDLVSGDSSDDVVVQPGDLVVVPTKTPDQVAREQLAQMALVAGAVTRPQLMPLAQAPTVRRAIVFAGGTAPDADLEGSYILRGEQLVYVDLGAIMNGEAVDVPLQAGDLLVVPILTMERALARQAAVTGAVMQPRPAPLSQARTVSRAIIYAGGPAPTADLSATYLLRGNERIAIDGQAALSGSGPDPELRPGDMLVVPQISQLPVVIVGAVRQASAQPANMAGSVAKAVTLAGGLLPTADGKRGYVLRDGSRIDVDISAILAGGTDFPLKPSDLLVVPTMTAANQMAASVLVMGAVARPGMIPAELASSVRQAILLAGGFTTSANPAQCQLLRRELSSEVDLEAVMSGTQPDFAVGGGDVLIVPDKADAMVYVAGAVSTPGPQAHHWSNSVSRALALASPAAQADLERTYVLRGATRVDIDALRILHGEEADFDLLADDLIVVPLKSPEADLASRARESVTIAGAVARPGLFAPEQCDTVARAMAWVGGPTPQADLEHAYVLREKQTISVNLAQLGSEGGPGDVALQANDILVVPVLTPEMLAAQDFARRIMVSGAVPQPGMLLYEQAGTVNAALAMAGGVTEAADLEGSYVLREGIRHDINVKAMRSGTAPDFPLQPRDVLVVPPRIPETVMVAGAVRSAGRIPLEQASTVLSALTVSGGAAEAADLRAAFVLRDGERIPVDLRAVIAGESEDVPLQADDVLMVPAADPDPVYVIGNVRAPGAHPITRAVTASKALVLSGGPIDHVSDLRGAYIMRGSERIPVDLDAVVNKGQAGSDVPLLANDALVVPKAEENFHVIGEVKQPGSYLLTQADTVLAALAIAGGTLPSANLEAATLLRDGQTIPLDLRALLDNEDYATNLDLQAGDTLVIPLSKARVFVFGSVGRPGAYPLQPRDTYLDLIAHAGGLSGQSRIDRIWIVRSAAGNPASSSSATSGNQTVSQPTAAPAQRTTPTPRTRRPEQDAGGPSINQAFGGAPPQMPSRASRDGSRVPSGAPQGAPPVRVKERYSITELTRLDAASYAGKPQDGDLIYVPGPKERKQNLLDWLLNIGLGRLLFND